MAKKTTAKKPVTKKPRRRLKRTARRSLAAVLMITAVVVAAIPVPENQAAPEGGISMLADEPEPAAFSYPEHNTNGEMIDKTASGSSTRKLCPGTNLAKPADATEYSATTVSILSDGSYQLDWQFKFFLAWVEGNERGIISRYNATYMQEEVVLNPNVIYRYDTIPIATVNNFFTNTPVDFVAEYTLSRPKAAALEDPLLNADQFFNEYFNSLYTEQIAAYEKYDKDHDTWLNDPNRDLTLTNDPTEPQKPADITRKISQLGDTQREKYYCDVNRTTAGQLAGCRLVKVTDSENASAGVNTEVYIPQKIEGQTPSGKFDANNLRYINESSIIGIGNEAFKGTRNVFKLDVPREIKYVGKSAFESSFIKEISFVNVEEICDYAFKDCRQLTKIDFGIQPTTTTLGVESFYGTAVTEVQFPATIEEIGPGAFAYCESLQKLDFSKISASPAVIHEYAFYNDVSLNSVNFMQNESQTVNIDTMGDGAFAVATGVVGNLTEFKFPNKISKALIKATGDGGSDDGHGLGNCVLAGRSNLTTVIMPSDFGRSQRATVPGDTFYNCYNLACVEFPDDGNGSCGRATYDTGVELVTNSDGEQEKQRTSGKGLFRTVSNPDFYVQGPELDGNRNQATPRKQTWDAATAVSYIVPYLYVKGGLNYWEISDGDYLMCVNDKGLLTSCTRKDPTTIKKNIDLVIPAKVGKTDVTGISSTCFSDKDLNNNVRSLKIADDGLIAEINDNAFQGWETLGKVYIGNSIAKIGDYAFEGCGKLVDVTFSSPLKGHGTDAFTIGKDAFKTGSEKLTFHGDIVKGYAPFEWATDADNIIKEPDGIRVCYKSLAPTFLTVMYDENTGLVTLLDYPKMSQVPELLNETYADEIKAGDYGTYEHMREMQSYVDCSGEAYNTRREAFKTAWMEDPETAYDSESYGPWITPDFCKTAADWGTAAPDPGTGGDTGAAIMDFLFEPITVYAAATPDPYFTRHPFKVGSSDSIYPELKGWEIELLDAVHEIEVPEGVDSIDVYKYYHHPDVEDIRNRNRNNAGIYLEGELDWDVWRMYTSRAGQDEDGSTTRQPGLFSGYYDDGLTPTTGEKNKRGNDQIQKVTLNSVQYLPDYAFDSCENLLEVDLGPECKNIGIAPFRGCYEMETVGDNQWYTTTNGIIYSKNADGTLTIEECLSARGRKSKVGPPIVNAGATDEDGDVNLKSVSAIKPGAFEDCDDLTQIDFGSNNTAGLKVIPEDCFKNSDKLYKVILPITVNDIGRGAFVGAKNLGELTIYGSEVKISGSAFDGDKVPTTVKAPEDSAVVRYVKEYGSDYNLVMDSDPFGKQWKVSFYDANYKLIEDLVDAFGDPIDNPQYATNGRPVEDWPVDPVMDGWTFEEWIGLNGATQRSPITEDTIFYAKGHYDAGAPVDGSYIVEFIDGVDGSQLAGRYSHPADGKYYIPAGESFADQGWPESEITHPYHAGYEEAGFAISGFSDGEWTPNTVINGNMTVVALYKPVANGGTTSGGSTNTPGGTTSGGATNTSGSTTSNRSSSSSSSSSSTSSSSTSTTSTTTSGAGMYTVFVENGYGSGSYAPGTMVIVTAAQPAAGMRFDKWTTESNGVTLVSVSLPATTFVMPSNNVSIKANFVADTTPQTAAAPSSGGSGNTNNDTGDRGNTRVDIEKPGISNRDLATANVNGSTDNFVIKISETDEATRAVSAALTNKYGTLDNILYYAMDITLWDSTGTYQLTGDQLNGISVDITIPIPDSLVAYGGNNMAGAVINGDQLESLNENFTTINGVPCIRFRATHFSPYTIYVDTGNLVEGMLDTTPKTGDPIHPKWFLSLGLACLSMILFLKRDKKRTVK